MIKAAILDDEVLGGQALLHKLELLRPELEVLAVFNDPLSAFNEIKGLNADVLFLDIEMPQLNGFEFLRQLGEFPFEVIFTTAYSSYAVEALRISAVDYLLKPIDEEELRKAFVRLRDRLSARKEPQPKLQSKPAIDLRIPLPTQQGIYLIKAAEIIRVEAMSNYSAFFLENGKKLVISKTLKEYEALLPDGLFLRVNRSVILNLNYVVKYRKGEGGTLELSDGTEIEVSPQRKPLVLGKLMIL